MKNWRRHVQARRSATGSRSQRPFQRKGAKTQRRKGKRAVAPGFRTAVAERSGDTAFRLQLAIPKRRGASLPAAVQNVLAALLRLCAFALRIFALNRRNVIEARAPLVLLLSLTSLGFAGDFTSLCAHRTAIERIYHNHRLGEKPPFEQALPRATLENLVRLDLKKESALQRNYGVTITTALLDAEVQRINTTTRAPEMLAEIKAALGNDPKRFAESFAKPFLVERLLRDKFENDDALHLAARRECEKTRNELLAAKTNGATATELIAKLKQARSSAVTESMWQLTPRPAENQASADDIEIKKRFGPGAQILSSPSAGADKERKSYFEDLPGELQNVLRIQLRRAGDVSAVIETPGGFLLYVTREKTDSTLSVAGLSLPKRSYEQWVEEQSEAKP